MISVTATSLDHARPGRLTLVAIDWTRLAIGIILAVILPSVIIGRFFAGETVSDAAWEQTQLVQIIVLIVADLLLRRLSLFPGSRASSYIIPVFTAAFIGLFLFYFISRLGYSRSQLLIGYILIVFWYFITYFITKRIRNPIYGVIPGGNSNELETTDELEMVHLGDANTPVSRYDALIADFRADLDDDWERVIARQALAGQAVYHSKQVQESITGEVSIEHLSENNFGSLIPSLGYAAFKSLIDKIAVILVLPILIPVMVIVAVLVKISSNGRIFFSQTRVGYRGETFTIHKFRTMRDGAHVKQAKVGDAITMTDDDRITSIGRFLRRSRLDELPQVLNILKGEMSWIGPRPEAQVLSSWYAKELPFYEYRHIVRPGITGWAQVNQGHVVELDEVLGKLRYDFFYIKYFSPSLDILIALRTVRVLLMGIGWK